MSQTIRQRCATVLRGFRVLQLADFAYFLWIAVKQRKSNRLFCSNHPDVCVPPLWTLYDIMGNCDIESYFHTGKEHASLIRTIICRTHSERPLKILEWGCGPARVLQHLAPPPAEKWDLFGSDYNADTIDWCRRNLPHIVFIHNNLAPPLQADAAGFDVLYCISVFTHLSEPLHYQWIQEIHRLLKPGGLFIGTFHGESYRDDLSVAEQRKFDKGELVVRDKIQEGKKNFAAYQGNLFTQNLLSPFSSSWMLDDPGFNQTVWCAIK